MCLAAAACDLAARSACLHADYSADTLRDVACDDSKNVAFGGSKLADHDLQVSEGRDLCGVEDR